MCNNEKYVQRVDVRESTKQMVFKKKNNKTLERMQLSDTEPNFYVYSNIL